MAVDLLGLGVTMLRCLAGSAIGFMVSKGVRSAASETGGSIRNFLQKDIDQIREKLDSMAQSKLSAALQNVRQGLILLDQQFSIAAPSYCASSASASSSTPCSDEGTLSLCVTTRTVLAADSNFEISADVRHQFELAQQLAVEAFHDNGNVPPMLRVECLKLQLFCTMLIHHQTPERWLGLWTVILEELAKDKELAAAASAACENGCSSSSVSKKSALALFWRKSNTDLSQALCNLVENLHCALIAALWHPGVDARVAFGRSRILQYPRLLLCSTNQSSQQYSSTTVNLEAPFLYPWRADRVVVVLPGAFKLLSLYPTNKILSAQIRPGENHSNGTAAVSFSLHILDTLTLTEDESLQLENDVRLMDVEFDRKSLNVMVLCTTARDGQSVVSFNLQFEKNFKINLSLESPCSQLICDPFSSAVITFEGTSAEDKVYVLQQGKDAGLENGVGVSYENIFKCILADRPGSIGVAYAQQFWEADGEEGTNLESGLELLLFNRFTDVAYSLVMDEDKDSISPNSNSTSVTDSAVSSSTSFAFASADDDSIAKIQQIYPLKTPLLKVRVCHSGKMGEEAQKVMLEESGIFDDEQLAWAKEKCLTSSAILTEESSEKSAPPPGLRMKRDGPVLVGAYVANDEMSTLNVFEAVADEDEAVGMRFKAKQELQLPLFCEQKEDRYLGGVVWLDKFIFVGALMCKVKVSDG